MKYIIKVNDYYIKYTSNFGHFHGSAVLTKNKREAKMWTREKDALYKLRIVRYRYRIFEHEKKRFNKMYGISKSPTVIVETIQVEK